MRVVWVTVALLAVTSTAAAESFTEVSRLSQVPQGLGLSVVAGETVYSVIQPGASMEIQPYSAGASGVSSQPEIVLPYGEPRNLAWTGSQLLVSVQASQCLLVASPCSSYFLYHPGTQQFTELDVQVPIASAYGPLIWDTARSGCSSGCAFAFESTGVYRFTTTSLTAERVADWYPQKSAAQVGRDIYLASPSNTTFTRFNLDSQSYAQLPVPLPHRYMTLAAHGSRVIAIGGLDASSQTTRTVAWFDSVAGGMQQRPMAFPQPADFAHAAPLGADSVVFFNILTISSGVNPQVYRYDIANRLPAAYVTAPASVPVGTPAQFDSSGSQDPDGPLTMRWEFGDGRSSTLAAPSNVYDMAGTYTVTLTVTDFDGATATATRQIQVISGQSSTSTSTTSTSTESASTPPPDPTPTQSSSSSASTTTTGGLPVGPLTTSTLATTATPSSVPKQTPTSSFAPLDTVGEPSSAAPGLPFVALAAVVLAALAARRRL